MAEIFTTALTQPLFNILVFLYTLIPDFGIAIILLTIIVRLATLPVTRKSIESQKKIQELQPELKKIQEKFKHDKQLQSQKMMEFYKEKKINPAAGCLPMLIPMIIMIALFYTLRIGLNSDGTNELLYGFMNNPGVLNPIAFGFFDLTKASIPLAIIAAALTYVQGKMLQAGKKKDEVKTKKKNEEPDFSTIMQKQMIFLAPVMTLVFGSTLPSGLVLYWATANTFMIVQQYFVLKNGKENSAK